jgi:hypothetical protein
MIMVVSKRLPFLHMLINQIQTAELKNSDLFGEYSKKFIRTISNLMPVVSGLGLECRLNDSLNSATDISFRFLKEEGELFILLDCIDHQLNMGNCTFINTWQTLKGFISSCISDPLFSKVGVIWLEFDEEEITNILPLPGLFFNLINHDALIADFAINYIKTVKGVCLNDSIKNNIYIIYTNLPDESFIHYVGLFFSRENYPIRITVHIKIVEISSYINLVSETPLSTEIWELLSKLYRSGITTVVLNLNISDVISIEPGVEVKATKDCSWQKIISILSEQGWIIPDTVPKLNNWSDHHPSLDTPEILGRLSLRCPNDNIMNNLVYMRSISHIKLQMTAENVKIAKAYLYEAYGWIK